MEPKEFEKYLGRILADMNLFCASQNNSGYAAQVVLVATQLLERVVEHHRAESCSATLNAVKIYNVIAVMLERILATHLQMNNEVYEEARRESLAIDALMACGITPPGHHENRFSSRYGSKDHMEALRIKALKYACDNVEEFTRFVFDITSNNRYVRNRFLNLDQYDALALFQRVKSLSPGFTMIDGQPPIEDGHRQG
jgi:hypothetical protein